MCLYSPYQPLLIQTKVLKRFRIVKVQARVVLARCIFVHKNDLASLRPGTSLRNLRSLELYKSADHVKEKSRKPAEAFDLSGKD